MSTRRDIEVVEVDGGARWLVESRSFAPGAFWNVTYRMEHYVRRRAADSEPNAGAVAMGERYELRCACPHGARQASNPDLSTRTPCRHLDAVVRFQVAKQARPVAPVNVAALCD